MALKEEPKHVAVTNDLSFNCNYLIKRCFIYIYIYISEFEAQWHSPTCASLRAAQDLPVANELPLQGPFRYLGEKEGQQWHPTSQPMRFRLLVQDVPIVLSELSKDVSCDTNGFFLLKAVLQVRTGGEGRSLVTALPTLAWCRAVGAVPLCACVVFVCVCVVCNP